MGYKRLIQLLLLIVVLVLIRFLFKKADRYTSSNAYCNSCHVHNHAHVSWMESVHYSNCEGVEVACVDCHLPPKGQGFYKAKLHAGIRDLYAFHFKDSTTYNWAQKSLPENARHHTFEASCIACHPKLFPTHLSKNGEIAHWHYKQHSDELHCIDCHIDVGHGSSVKASHNYQILETQSNVDTIYQSSFSLVELKDFTETIPKTNISFSMVAIQGGTTTIGASGKPSKVKISPFFIGQIEVTWDEYLVFLRETEAEGRSQQSLDGLSGATPPWGNPDQGWGMGQRPAITMTHHAATVYCQWLSARTGKNYRLPTEAEWEYVAQNALKADDKIEDFINNTKDLTLEPEDVKFDALGLRHLFGNVKEFCSDSYSDWPYQSEESLLLDPVIRLSVNEHVVKGGSFKTDVNDLRPSYRESTQHDKWMKTDPQIPKSIWWYSDCNDVGFRVVLKYQQKD